MAMLEDAGTGFEHRSYRLPNVVVETIVDIARGVEEGEAGLKSCALADRDGALGVSIIDARAMLEASSFDDVDDYFNALGDLLADGFTHAEAFREVQLETSEVHLLALERWCAKAKLQCDADEPLPTELMSRRWRGSALHERRRRARRAFNDLRSSTVGAKHASVLHVVYGWPDPFLRTLTPEARSAFGNEFGPLARYTDAVEGKRQEMVKAEAVRHPDSAAFGNWFAFRNLEHKPDDGERSPGDRYRQGGALREMASADGRDPDEFAHLVDLARVRDRRAWADRMISSGDALRDGTDRLITPDKDERDAFVTAIRIDANRMLTEASLAFNESWTRS